MNLPCARSWIWAYVDGFFHVKGGNSAAAPKKYIAFLGLDVSRLLSRSDKVIGEDFSLLIKR